MTREGSWLKEVDVAAWFTLLSLDLAYTLAVVLTWAPLTAEKGDLEEVPHSSSLSLAIQKSIAAPFKKFC